MFEPNLHLLAAIEEKNITRIRSAFTTIAYEDPSFSSGKFDAALAFVKSKNIDGLFTVCDQREFCTSEEWDKDYWALRVSSLMDDFSQENIDHLKAVSRKVYPPIIRNTASGAPSKKAQQIAITTGFAITSIAALAVGAKVVAAAAGTVAIIVGINAIMKD